MATRYNPYALDPALSAGIGNLTKALIGSASDDAAIARGRASDALASYRQAQTQGQKILMKVLLLFYLTQTLLQVFLIR